MEILIKPGQLRIACRDIVSNKRRTEKKQKGESRRFEVIVRDVVGGRLTNIRAIDETEEIQQRHDWYDVEIYLPSQLCFGLRVELNEGLTISGKC